MTEYDRHPEALALTRRIREAADEEEAAKLLIDYCDDRAGRAWELGWNDRLNVSKAAK